MAEPRLIFLALVSRATRAVLNWSTRTTTPMRRPSLTSTLATVLARMPNRTSRFAEGAIYARRTTRCS